MATLPPVPGPNITDKSQNLLPPWRSWFSQLYTYVTQQLGAVAPSANPAFTGTISINGATIHTGYNSPQGVVVGNPGDLYLNQNGGQSTLWVKQYGVGTTGWTDGGFYGSFYDSTTQTAVSATTAYTITLNTTEVSNGVTIGSPTSRIIIANQGNYNIQFSAQLQNTDTAFQDVQIWLRQNGVDVTASSGLISIPSSHGGVAGHTVAGWNYVVSSSVNDYFELVWQSSSSLVTLQNYAAGTTPTRPGSPSMSVTVTQI